MTRLVGDDSPQSRMRIARNAAEFVLYGIREIPTGFDRAGVAATIQDAIACIYRALDAGPDSLVQPEALSRAATLLSSAREGLLRTSVRRTLQIERASEILADAKSHAQAAAQAVAFDQLERRMELPWGETEVSLKAEPFRSSIGTPQLHAPKRDAVAPLIELGEAEPEPEPVVKVALAQLPNSVDELKDMARELFAAMQEPGPEDEQEPAAAIADAPAVADTPIDLERQMIGELARDAIEDIASLGSLRHPIETESWLDQAPFEQRLLNRLDHFCSLGIDALRAAVLYQAEAESPDEARAFALAFALGCVDGCDTIDAIVSTIRQSPPEIFRGFVEGLVLATNPNVHGAMRMLLGMNDEKLVAVGLEVLAQRRALTPEDLEWVLGSDDSRVQILVARALGTNLEPAVAFERLDRIYTRAETGSDLHLTAIESGIRRCQPSARQELRRILARPVPGAGTGRAASLLGLSGNSRDFELLLGAAQVEQSPLVLEGLGRLGHVGTLPYLLHVIDEQDETMSPVAAKELERITGAGLIDEVEEPWIKELPPEAADMDIPVPLKKVRRVTTNPERWRQWERTRGKQLDPMKKHRAGVPFAPPQLLAELEALEPRNEERERSYLELCAATGKEFGFRSDAWVVDQCRSFGRAREYFERHSFEAGTWCFSGSGIAARPERKQAPVGSPLPGSEATLPWQFDVVVAAEASQPSAEPVAPRVSEIEGQSEIPDYLRVAIPVASPPPGASNNVPSAAGADLMPPNAVPPVVASPAYVAAARPIASSPPPYVAPSAPAPVVSASGAPPYVAPSASAPIASAPGAPPYVAPSAPAPVVSASGAPPYVPAGFVATPGPSVLSGAIQETPEVVPSAARSAPSSNPVRSPAPITPMPVAPLSTPAPEAMGESKAIPPMPPPLVPPVQPVAPAARSPLGVQQMPQRGAAASASHPSAPNPSSGVPAQVPNWGRAPTGLPILQSSAAQGSSVPGAAPPPAVPPPAAAPPAWGGAVPPAVAPPPVVMAPPPAIPPPAAAHPSAIQPPRAPAAPQPVQPPAPAPAPGAQPPGKLQPPMIVSPAEHKRPIAPATFFDANIKDLAPGLKPLKKLPWEK